MSDEELKITRRLFLQHAAVVSAMSAGIAGIALKTDAVARAEEDKPEALQAGGPSPYPYQ
jgi:hypothetical protein